MEFVRKRLAQLTVTWGQLSPSGRMAIVMTLLLVVAILVITAHYAGKTELAALPAHIPSDDLGRAMDLLRAKHRLSKFLLRRAIYPPVGVRAWSRAHEAWLDKLAFEHAADGVVLEHYRAVASEAAQRVKRLETALAQCAAASPHAELLAALQALRGIGFLTAVTIVAEAGDLRRFRSARQFMAYVGLVPSEHSSGASRHQGRITKTGNRLIRHVLGQAAHNARYRPNVSTSLRARQRRVPPAVVELDRRAQARLHQRYRHLAGRIGTNKTVIAVARELAGFVWATGQLVPTALAA